tara:strand:+ start:520 stop:633 length:114 start_codon:yes stop_codon:yes gene_type:complete
MELLLLEVVEVLEELKQDLLNQVELEEVVQEELDVVM